MKLRNKKNGEIVDTLCEKHAMGIAFGIDYHDGEPTMVYYNSLAELNKEWEDYEEPKEYWYLENNGDIDKETYDGDGYEERMIEIGNYFDTREEAEKAVEKLKAWKRLKDNGFRFEGTNNSERKTGYFINYYLGKSFNSQNECEQAMKDLDLLFGGEE